MKRNIVKFIGGPNDGFVITSCDLMGEYVWTKGCTQNLVICHGTYSTRLPCYKRESEGVYRFIGYTTRENNQG